LDSIAHTQKLYARIDWEITAFVALLSEIARDPDSVAAHQSKAIHELGLMLGIAKEIGGKLLQDIELLKTDFHRFLIQAESLQKIQQDAMRIKHEVRPL
jgi:hypothetical protein